MIIQSKKPLPARREHDYYPTPAPFAEAGLSLLPDGFAPRSILDPGAGAGVWGNVARARWPKAMITGVELRDEPHPEAYNGWVNMDFRLWMEAGITYDLVMGNPPYKYAEEFVRESLVRLTHRGWLVFMLRLAFLESRKRLRLWADSPPVTVAVCANRPSFTGDRKTNATAFAFFVWQQGYTGDTQLQWVYSG